ncbi:MAG: AsmA family protein [Rhizobiaceae bacterium]|nr:MAG: AsmA family protein [Rhizobiaceae bacterium]
MPSKAAKKIMWAALVAILAAAVIFVTLPLLASTQIVRYRIAQEMEALTGYRVTLGDAPEIRIWPSFHGVLKNVTLSEWGSDNQPVVEADQVDIDLSAVAALMGRAEFASARFIRPVIRVAPHGLLYLPASPGGGRIVDAIQTASEAVSANPSKPDTSALPSHSLGTIEISDGRVVVANKGAERTVVDKLAGKIDWPALNSAASVSLTGKWRGQDFKLDFSLGQPLVLFGGGTSDLSVDLGSTPLAVSFEGTANLSQNTYFDGQIKLAAQSVRQVLEWSGSGMASGAPAGPLTVTSHLSGNSRRLKLDKAEIALDKNPGMGVIEISMLGATPSISGTLAFDQFDIGSFLTAFTPLVAALKPGPDEGKMANKLNVDLRLSANKALAGPIPLANIAATAQVKGGLSVFDISDATAFGGSVQAGLHLDRQADGNHVELRMHAADIDLSALTEALGVKGLLAKTPATIAFSLKGIGETWKHIFSDGHGTFSAKLGAGSIKGFDLSDFIKRTKAGGFFSLRDVANGSLKLAKAEIKATIVNGLAKIDKATASGPPGSLSLVGVVPYLGGGLALSGTLTPADSKPTTNFFIGGLWSAPFVAPAIPALLPP